MFQSDLHYATETTHGVRVLQGQQRARAIKFSDVTPTPGMVSRRTVAGILLLTVVMGMWLRVALTQLLGILNTYPAAGDLCKERYLLLHQPNFRCRL